MALLAGLCAAWTLFALTAVSSAAVSCPNSNPVLHENNCMGAGTESYRLNDASEDIGGFSVKTSFNLGEAVQLKIARNVATFPATKVNIALYRTGFYGGTGARQISAGTASNVTVNNSFTCNPKDQLTGKMDCGNWAVTHTIPASALTTSGVYVAKLTATDTGIQNQIVFTVRDDNRATESKLLFILPVADYEAYNLWGGKSLYFDKGDGGPPTVSGGGRAVKVSFNRPLWSPEDPRNHYFGPDFDTVQWLEQQGYDVSYTDDVQAHLNPAELLQHRILIIPGHSEYWSLEQFNGIKAARDAGVNIASFSANTAYWKVRYEDGARTLVCYKTVQGDGAGGSGSVTPNDPGPDGAVGTADDALGLDGIALTADDRPQNSTTTFRDNGAANGDPNAPPGGRVGPDMPENMLFGVMYFGDHEWREWPLTVPAGNASNEFATDRIWRNAGLSGNSTNTIGSRLVAWEWDSVPTQAQYLSRQPAGVIRLSATNTSDTESSWLQDEGRARNNVPPPGQPATVNAVRYTAPSGAKVFASGTMQWSLGLASEPDARIKQATYNIFSDMGVQPLSPTGITLDPPVTNPPPTATFSFTPAQPKLSQVVTFDATGSTDTTPGTITKYEWDLDGNGTYETDRGTLKTATKTYTAEGPVDVRLKVTDNGGATDFTTRTVTVVGNLPPTASFTATPNPATAGATVAFSAAASTDPDGTIAMNEWDLDGNGSYETNTGTTKTTSRVYTAVALVTVGLRVTDNGGKTATSTVVLDVRPAGASNYGDAVLDTPGLKHFWRMGEAAGPTLADSKGTRPATLTGGTPGQAGGPAGETNKAIAFNGASDFAKADVDLSGTPTTTVEFWLKWDRYTNDDALALELTRNFNQYDGGFIVDPNAASGNFAVSMGRGQRNAVNFTRPSAGVWHHYAFVLSTAAPAATEITPYVDGVAVSYTKPVWGNDNTTGNFANDTMHFMSRGGLSLFGAGTLDELAIYDRALDTATVQEHFNSYGMNRRPVAAFTMTPASARPGQSVTFNGASSSDPDGTIKRYQWDLDGNGSYETDGGTSATTTRTYAAAAELTIGLRVTDTGNGIDSTTRPLSIGNGPPTASFTATPNPAIAGQSVTFDGSGSSDTDGSITKLEWDLDGNGSYEVDTGTTRTTAKTYAVPGTITAGLRVTDNEGKTATTTVPVTITASGVSNYGDAVLDTAGLLSYWRMGEAAGPTLADSKSANHATATGATFGAAGAVASDPNKAVSFNGTTNFASAPVNLSGAAAITVEFWLKWNAFDNDDDLAMEFTPNFNNTEGGFIVDPDAPQQGGRFAVSIGRDGSRNNAFFTRPTAGAWHHYAFVLDSTKPGAQVITPYVDGQVVAYTKQDSGTGLGRFANSTLYMMSRGGQSLFGTGTLDEVALYDRALTGAKIAEHYSSSGTNRRPLAALTASPSPALPGQTVTFNAAGSTDPDGTITKYEWDLDGNGSYELNTGTTATTTKAYAAEGTYNVTVRVTDNQTGNDTETVALTVANGAPTASFTATPSKPLLGQAVTFDAAASTDPDGTITKYEWDLDGNGSYETDTGTTKVTTRTYTAPGTITVRLRVTDNNGKTGITTRTVTPSSATYADTVLATTGLINYWRMGESAGTTLADGKGTSPATLTGGTLGQAGGPAGDSNTAVGFNGVSNYARSNVNLSATRTITVEFWLKWNGWTDTDALALELTENYNGNDGGFIVDPDASNGAFAVGLGVDGSRNTAFFTRPAAGTWHHYAFVLDATAPAATQITPYVDGVPVAYTKGSSGTGAPVFANGTLYFMSRAGAALFGAGTLDELAIYDRALGAAAIAEHYDAGA